MKRVLIVTYYWPPAGGPGVQRWLKFVKYFKEFGIEPVIYIPENPNYPLIDENLASEVPSDLEILKTKISEPYKFAKFFSKKKTKQISSGIISKKNPSIVEKLMLYVRGNFFIPDARISWVKPSVAYITEYLSANKIDLLITTGPPHSLHLIGMELKRKTGITWLADFRDPWTTIHYHNSLQLTKSSEKKHKDLESEVLNTADLITVTSPTTKKEFQELTNKNIEIVTNGFDISEEIKVVLDSKFSIAHIGSLLTERNPLVLWDVLSEITSENSEFKKDLKIVLAGAVSQDVKDKISEVGLLKNCEFLGYISHSEALKLQRKVQILLLVEMDKPETRAIIPGKLFEYLSAKRPILAMGPALSDIENIIENTKSGNFFTFEEKENLKNVILKWYQLYKSNNLQINSEGIENYSRRELTKKMASIIENLV